jgi:hypothetical protein
METRMKPRTRHRWEGPGAVGHCRSCGAPIRWLLSPRSKLVPTDTKGVSSNDTQFDPARHVLHFTTCRQQDLWRTPWNESAS